MARATSVYRCQQCGFASPKPGTCPDCRRATGELVPLVEERAAPAPSGSARAAPAGTRPTPLKDVVMERGRPRAHRHRRARPRAGRRRRARLARADRRRSGHRQEHAAAAGGPRAGAGGAAGALRVGRGVGGAGEDARRSARHRRATGCCCGRRTICRRCRPSSTTIKPRALVDRLDPDGVPARSRVGAGQRGPGARVRRPPDDARQGARHRHVPGGPRHQGGRAGRAARARAPGRHRALLRGRASPRLPRAARGEEPLRLDERDRRVRDGGARARRGAEPVRLLPRRASGRRAGLGHRLGARGHAAAAARAAGARRRAPSFGTPRRTVLGADYNRVCLLLAVLEKRAGLPHRQPGRVRQRRGRRPRRRAGGRSRHRHRGGVELPGAAGAAATSSCWARWGSPARCGR